jgi:cell division protease FtsH
VTAKWNQRRSNRTSGGMNNGISGYIPWIILALAIITGIIIGPKIVSEIQNPPPAPQDLSYTQFHQALDAGNIAKVQVTQRLITGTYRTPVMGTDKAGKKQSFLKFTSYLPEFGDATLTQQLVAKNVEFDTHPDSGISWSAVLSNVLPVLLFGLLGFIIFRSVNHGQGILPGKRNRAQLYNSHVERTTFDDVAGERGAKHELQEIIEILKDPSHYQRLGAATPKGVLLVGPPGTGKTLLARAVAGEAGVPFYSITGSDFMEMFVGVGASRVRELFIEAKRHSPCIIFIDEIDSIGRKRNIGSGGAQEEREQTLNQLLSEMDGFQPSEGVIIIAATNRPEVLDPALMRAGRFDRRVVVDLPSMRERLEILLTHARNKPLSDKIDLEAVARGTPGFSGADLENLLNESALMAARKRKDHIEPDDIEDARDKILMGLERDSILLTDEECRLIAYHEAGHAIAAALLPYADPIHKVTIVPRGRAMGVTQQLPEREKFIYAREDMLDRLAVMMGGRAAEVLVFNTATSGAENDLKQATHLARRMVLDWGMSENLGNIALGSNPEQIFLGDETSTGREYSELTAQEIDHEVRAIVEDSYRRVGRLLAEHHGQLDQLASLLIEKEIVSGHEVLELLGKDTEHVHFNSPKSEVLWNHEQEKEYEEE